MKELKSFFANRSFLFKTRFIFGMIILITVLVFLYLKTIPSGNASYSRTWPRGLATGKGFIYDFKPAERIDANVSLGLRLVAEPVYFSFYSPRGFDTAELTIKYRSHLATATPIIEVGVLRDKLSGQYELQPIENDIVDSYRFSWSRLEDAPGRLILQKEKYYDDASAFENDLKIGSLKECPGGPTACVAAYNYPLDVVFRLPDYSEISPTVINQPLRGAHQFYVYFRPGFWRLAFDFKDLNLDRGQDPITVNVYSGSDKVASQILPDNNPTSDDGRGEDKSLIVSGSAAVSGLYRVEIKVSDDIVISKLSSSSDRISFINKIWPVSGSDRLVLFTDASQIGVSTINPVSLGKISFGDAQFNLDQTYQQVFFSAAAGVNKIILNKDDLVLENSGVFAFSPASLINPGVKKIDRYFAAGDNIKYIVAAYDRPLEDNGVKTARAFLNLKAAEAEDNKYTFLISIPGLDGQIGSDNYLDIEEISLRLKGKNIFTKAMEILRGIFKR